LFVPAWAVDFGGRREEEEEETKLRVSVWIGDSEVMWEKGGGDRWRSNTVSFFMGRLVVCDGVTKSAADVGIPTEELYVSV
jgi:hypothetical protein